MEIRFLLFQIHFFIALNWWKITFLTQIIWIFKLGEYTRCELGTIQQLAPLGGISVMECTKICNWCERVVKCCHLFYIVASCSSTAVAAITVSYHRIWFFWQWVGLMWRRVGVIIVNGINSNDHGGCVMASSFLCVTMIWQGKCLSSPLNSLHYDDFDHIF